MKYLVTGAAGFIGSFFVKMVLSENPLIKVEAVDSLSYAGDLSRLDSVRNHPGFTFHEADICDSERMKKLLEGCDSVFHFAAQSHVDRSLQDCSEFFRSNCYGTQTLIDAAVKNAVRRFIHISTDEVYGSRPDGCFKESDRYNPTNPYSVSKAAAEQLAFNAYRHDGLPVLITRGANTYGPYQYPEKLIPYFVSEAMNGRKLPVYGDGLQQRDWLHVEDHCRAVLHIARCGQPGEVYNIPGNEHRANIDLTRSLLAFLGKDENLIQFVSDRKGHDRRYAMDGTKLSESGFKHCKIFSKEFRETVSWYADHLEWLSHIRKKGASDSDYFTKQYSERNRTQ